MMTYEQRHSRLECGGPAKDQPVPTVVRGRKRQQDVAPNCEGLVYEHPQRYLQVGAL